MTDSSDAEPLSKTIEDTESTSRYQEMKITCVDCKNENALDKILYIQLPGEPEKVISSSYCNDCGGRETKLFTVDESNMRNIFVTAKIYEAEDLKRFLTIPAESRIKFIFSDEIEHEYTSMNDITGTVEGLLHQIVEDVSDIYGFKGYSTNTGDDRYKVEKVDIKDSTKRETKLLLSNCTVDLTIEKNIEETLLLVKKNAVEPNFSFEISDRTGNTRIAARGKFIRECLFEDLSTFNDEFIKHTYIE